MSPVPSPCRKVCDYDPRHGWCLSCGRTLDEIGGWMQASEAEKRAILARAEGRVAPSS